MEHPYLFFVKLFEMFGLGHFAHTYPHVIYSWVVMILLIVLGIVGAKSINLVPSKIQNVICGEMVQQNKRALQVFRLFATFAASFLDVMNPYVLYIC